MHRIHRFFRLERRAALHTTQVLLMCFGAVLSVAFLAALPWWLELMGIGVGAFAWILLYRIELGVRAILSRTEASRWSDEERMPKAHAG